MKSDSKWKLQEKQKTQSATNRLDWVRERRLGLTDKTDEIDDTVKENVKPEKSQELSMKEIRNIMKSPNLWVMVYSKETGLRSKALKVVPAKSEVKEEMPINLQEVNRTPNRQGQKRNSHRQNNPNTKELEQGKDVGSGTEKIQVMYEGGPCRKTPGF